jgi:hypothetical protein
MFLPFAVSSSNKPKAKLLPLYFAQYIRVLDVKTLKIGIGGVRKKKGGWAAAFIAA